MATPPVLPGACGGGGVEPPLEGAGVDELPLDGVDEEPPLVGADEVPPPLLLPPPPQPAKENTISKIRRGHRIAQIFFIEKDRPFVLRFNTYFMLSVENAASAWVIIYLLLKEMQYSKCFLA